MERTWKNFKLDPNKVCKRIGQAVVYLSFNIMCSAMLFYGFMTATTLN